MWLVGAPPLLFLSPTPFHTFWRAQIAKLEVFEGLQCSVGARQPKFSTSFTVTYFFGRGVNTSGANKHNSEAIIGLLCTATVHQRSRMSSLSYPMLLLLVQGDGVVRWRLL